LQLRHRLFQGPLALQKELLGLLPFADVAEDADENAAVSPPRLGDRQLHGEGRAVSPLADDLAADADDVLLPRSQVTGHVLVVLFSIGGRH